MNAIIKKCACVQDPETPSSNFCTSCGAPCIDYNPLYFSVRLRQKMINNDGDVEWFAEYRTPDVAENPKAIVLQVEGIPEHMKNGFEQHKYKPVTQRHQIDEGGIFVTYAQSMRFNWIPLVGDRYAEQSDFDKFCVLNPDMRQDANPFDWNAAVWKTFSSHLIKHNLNNSIHP